MTDEPGRTEPTAVGRLVDDLRRVPARAWDVVLAATVLLTVLTSGATTVNDWHYYRLGGRLLLGDAGLRLYAEAPGIQLGPLSLVLARLLDLVGGGSLVPASVLTAALLVPVLACARSIAIDARGGDPLPRVALVCGTGAVTVGWFSVVAIGQFGDALALLGTLLAARSLQRGNPVVAGLLFGLGVAFKPWTLAALPLLLLAPSRGWLRATGTAVAVVVLTWLPFVLADADTLGAGAARYVVPPDAWQHVLGIDREGPDWWRASQLLVCWAVLVVLALRARRTGHPLTALPVVLAVSGLLRLLTELGTWPYYVSTVLPMVWLLDLTRTRGPRVPWATLLTFVALVNLTGPLGGGVAAAVRAGCLLAALVLCLAWSSRTPHQELLATTDGR